MLDYSIKLPKNRRLSPVGFYVMPFFINLLKLLLKNHDKRYIIHPINTGLRRILSVCQINLFTEIKMKAFEKLPECFQNDGVKQYYDTLKKKSSRIFFKRVLDILLSLIMLVFLIVPIIVISIMVKATSKGPVMFRQERVTTYGRKFKILKFRTMVVNAESLGTQVTTDHDDRVTKIGRKLRKYRLDELPQIFNVLSGSMSFVGVRPEVPKYVEQYEDVYYATLLMPAGITSPASIQYKDEEKLLAECDDADKVYIEQILPEKMKYNLSYIENFGFFSDIGIMFKTVVEVAK